jgi:hypothetical protein
MKLIGELINQYPTKTIWGSRIGDVKLTVVEHNQIGLFDKYVKSQLLYDIIGMLCYYIFIYYHMIVEF